MTRLEDIEWEVEKFGRPTMNNSLYLIGLAKAGLLLEEKGIEALNALDEETKAYFRVEQFKLAIAAFRTAVEKTDGA